MTDNPKLTGLQMRRLASALEEALTKRRALYVAKILDAPLDKTDKLATNMTEADERFHRLLKARGLCVGDTVRIVVDGPYKDVESEIRHLDPDGARVEVKAPDDTTVVPYAYEVELVNEKNHQERRRAGT
jgi:transcription antitermination factor NusG